MHKLSIFRLPEKSESNVPNILSRVDLPEPDGPIKTRISPLSTAIWRLFKTGIASPALWYILEIFCASSMGIIF